MLAAFFECGTYVADSFSSTQNRKSATLCFCFAVFLRFFASRLLSLSSQHSVRRASVQSITRNITNRKASIKCSIPQRVHARVACCVLLVCLHHIQFTFDSVTVRSHLSLSIALLPGFSIRVSFNSAACIFKIARDSSSHLIRIKTRSTLCVFHHTSEHNPATLIRLALAGAELIG